MRENESDSEDGWPPPRAHTSPWAARDPADDDQASSDIVAFGPTPDPAGDEIRGWYAPPGDLDPWSSGGDHGGSGPGSSPPASVASGTVPSPHDNAPVTGGPLNLRAVERKVVPGLVDITSTLKYASETAEGTGMILSSSGLVLTNNHVIDGATVVKVKMADNPGQVYTARVVGYDSTDDVALLKLDNAPGWPRAASATPRRSGWASRSSRWATLRGAAA